MFKKFPRVMLLILIISLVIMMPCWSEADTAADEDVSVAVNEIITRTEIPDFIEVKNPVNLPARIPCTRTAFEPVQDYPVETGYYKPCIAQLQNGDVLLMGFFTCVYFGDNYREDAFMYRSKDGGKTWSERIFPPIIGREPFLSLFSNGDVMVTTHLLWIDVRNNERTTHAYIHTSRDMGETWCIRKITEDEAPGFDKDVPKEICTTRNVLELKDGTRIFGLSTLDGPKEIWRSKDGSRTWEQVPCKYPGIEDKNIMMWETFLWQAKNGDVLGLYRIFPNKFPLKNKPVPPSDSDQYHGVVVFRSTDGGVTWNYDSDLGSGYGEMYPSILRLQDGRLLCNVSQRAFHPKGVKAALGEEYDDGFKFNFDSDVILIDTRTPEDESQGGGFGNTIQLPDGTLLTPYSYRGTDDRYHVEVARWRLPSVK